MTRHFPKGLDSRMRDSNAPKGGEIREKRGDTRVSTLRKEYGPDFAPGVRGDAKLSTLRERTGKSLSEMLHNKPRK